MSKLQLAMLMIERAMEEQAKIDEYNEEYARALRQSELSGLSVYKCFNPEIWDRPTPKKSIVYNSSKMARALLSEHCKELNESC